MNLFKILKMNSKGFLMIKHRIGQTNRFYRLFSLDDFIIFYFP